MALRWRMEIMRDALGVPFNYTYTDLDSGQFFSTSKMLDEAETERLLKEMVCCRELAHRQFQRRHKPSEPSQESDVDSEFASLFYTIAINNWDNTRTTLSDAQIFTLLKMGLEQLRQQIIESEVVVRIPGNPPHVSSVPRVDIHADELIQARNRFNMVSDEWASRLRTRSAPGGGLSLVEPNGEN